MNTQPINDPSESVYHEFHTDLVGYVHRHFRRISMFAEEVANDAFLDFWKYRAHNDKKNVWQVLKGYANHRAISRIRTETALKNGGQMIYSFECLREDGFEPTEQIFDGNWRTGGRESVQVLSLAYCEQLALVDQILEKAIPSLGEKELIVARHIRRWAPDELSSSELAEKLSPSERLRFGPKQKRSLQRDGEDFVRLEIGRSRGRLHRVLREIRRGMGG